MTAKDTNGEAMSLDTDDVSVSLTRILTPTGERLQIKGPEDSIRLDALALESLTWQDDSFFTDLTGIEHTPGQESTPTDQRIQIKNEYTVIQLTLLDTDSGPRLELKSPKLEWACRLSPAEIAVLTGQEIGFFSDLLQTPLGPQDDHEDPLFHH